MKTLAIIQARMGSTRLPGKVLLSLGGKTVIEQVVSRVRRSINIDEIIVATSIEKNNLPLIKKCSELGVRVFVGSENDVLDRYYQAAKLFKPSNVVRITADCPLIDSEVIDKVIETHIEKKTDYTTNGNPPTFPDGLDTEIFTFEALEKSWKCAKLSSEREHVTPYIIDSGLFTKANVLNDTDLSAYRWTLDQKEDYEAIKTIYENFGNEYFGLKTILQFVESNPHVSNINGFITRNEGYIKSIETDKTQKL